MTPEEIHRANVAYLCNPADVADLVARHDALRREMEALRAVLNCAREEAKRTTKTLIAGQVALCLSRRVARRQIEQLLSAASSVCDAPNVGLCIAAIERLRQVVKEASHV